MYLVLCCCFYWYTYLPTYSLFPFYILQKIKHKSSQSSSICGLPTDQPWGYKLWLSGLRCPHFCTPCGSWFCWPSSPLGPQVLPAWSQWSHLLPGLSSHLFCRKNRLWCLLCFYDMWLSPYALCIQSLNVWFNSWETPPSYFCPCQTHRGSVPRYPEVNRLGHYTVSSDGPVDLIELMQMWLSRAHLLRVLPCRALQGPGSGEAACATSGDNTGHLLGRVGLASAIWTKSATQSKEGYEEFGGNGYMCMCGWVPRLSTWNHHSVVNRQLLFSPWTLQQPLGEEHSQCQETAQQLGQAVLGQPSQRQSPSMALCVHTAVTSAEEHGPRSAPHLPAKAFS